METKRGHNFSNRQKLLFKGKEEFKLQIDINLNLDHSLPLCQENKIEKLFETVDPNKKKNFKQVMNFLI